uniref:Uncharacterized protein n=1 Tax=Glossina morsitans morsitans TaxID=37546 RepID=A0A1B0FHV4_GLOMM
MNSEHLQFILFSRGILWIIYLRLKKKRSKRTLVDSIQRVAKLHVAIFNIDGELSKTRTRSVFSSYA